MTNYQKGFAATTVLLIALGVIVLGAIGYAAMNPDGFKMLTGAPKDDGIQTEAGDHPEVDHDANEGMTADAKSSIAWKFTDAGEVDGMPHTNVTVVINGTSYSAGKFVGSCSEIGANGGIDSKGLLAGELSGAQCWFAGGGNEVGVFAHEDGGFDIMVGELSEGEAGAALFRGNFTVKNSIKL